MRLVRFLSAIAGWGIAAYLVAALMGSVLPANPGFAPPDDGVELFVETNGVHTGIVVPLVSDAADWRDLFQPEHMTDPRTYGSHVLIGWGHEGVYRNAERWTDLRSGDAVSAIVGSERVLLHVYHLHYPQAQPRYRRSLRVSEAQYRRLAGAIRRSIVTGPDGAPIGSPGYGPSDLFYRAKGNYTAFTTCNEWTSAVLREAGVRTGIWTPFAGGVMRWFR